jgi:hypothetical protein
MLWNGDKKTVSGLEAPETAFKWAQLDSVRTFLASLKRAIGRD